MTSTFCPSPLLADDFVHDPHPALARARRECPVYRDEDLGLWVVTRHEDVRRVLQDAETFSSANVQQPVLPICPAARQVLSDESFNPGRALVATDAPEHSQRRRYLVKALTLTPRRLALLEGRIRAVAHDMIDAFAADGAADLVARFTARLPAKIIYDIIGFPERDHERLLLWCLDRLRMSWGRMEEAEQVDAARGMAAYWGYCRAFVAGCMDQPPDNATGDLIRMHRAEPDKVTIRDIEDFLFGLVFAGQESTANLMAGTLLELLKEPVLWSRTVADPSCLPRVLEEAVRFISPINAWRRITTRAVCIGGIEMPAGAHVLAHIGSANRDDDWLPDGYGFNPDRNGEVSHLAFGVGAHFCIGAPLARVEARLALEALMSRLPELRLPSSFVPQYVPNVAFRVLAALPVEWDAERARPRPNN